MGSIDKDIAAVVGTVVDKARNENRRDLLCKTLAKKNSPAEPLTDRRLMAVAGIPPAAGIHLMVVVDIPLVAGILEEVVALCRPEACRRLRPWVDMTLFYLK